MMARWNDVLARWAILAIVSLLSTGALAQEKALKGVALVIGQSNYATLAPLPNPANDARSIAALLGDLGFNVDTLMDADAAGLSGAVAKFEEDAAGADVALVYYSGHGVEAGGENFLVPVDASLSEPKGFASATRLLERLQKTVPVAIILLDACRDNPFPPGATLADDNGKPQPIAAAGLGATRGVTRFTSDPGKPDSVGAIIGFAAEPGKVALDGEPGGESPYAAALLKHLAAGGFHFADIMTMVTEEVYLRSGGRQVPWTNASLRRQLFFGRVAEPREGDRTRIKSERRGLLLTIASLSLTDRAQVAAVAREEGVPMDVLFASLRAAGDQARRAPDEFDKMLREQGRHAKQRLLASGSTLGDPELARLAALADEAVREGALDAATEFHAKARARMEALSAGLTAVEAGTAALRKERAAVYAASAATWLLKLEHAKAAEDYGRAFAEIERVDDELAFGYKLAQAKALADQGYYRADNAALDAGVETFRDAADMAPLRRRPLDWLKAQAGLGNALATRGDREADGARLTEAVDTLRDAIAAAPADTPVDVLVDLRSEYAYALLLSGMRETGIDRLDQASMMLGEAASAVPMDKEPARWGRLMHRLAAVQYEIGRRTADLNTLEAALGAADAALQVRTRDATPIDWMSTQNNRAIILSELAARGAGNERIEQAIGAYRDVLQVGTRERGPLLWAETVANLGTSQALLAERTGSQADLDAALASFRLAAEEMTRERAPLRWAALQDNIGIALRRQGEKKADPALLKAAVEAFELALQERRRDVVPADWAATSGHLASAYWNLAQLSKDAAALEHAIAAARDAVEETPRDAFPRDWAMLRNNLGGMLAELAAMKSDPALYVQAADEYRKALDVFNPDDAPFDWARATGALGETLLEAGKLGKDSALLQQAKEILDQTVEIWKVFGDEKRTRSAELLASEAQLALLSLDVDKRLKEAGGAKN